MRNFRDKLVQFMYGRYGADQLYYALIVIGLILIVVNSFSHSTIMETLIWVLLILMTYRSFSRNIYKRRSENDKFLIIWNPVKAKVSLTIRRIREIKTHRYRKCPNCKKVLRLPIKKGKHTAKCPCCHNEFEVRILF
ncbi:MAG: hypothetical protein WCQ54_12255 [Clostridiaceae bacterium]